MSGVCRGVIGKRPEKWFLRFEPTVPSTRISDKMAATAAGAEEFDVEELLEAPYKKEVSVFILLAWENTGL